MARRLSSDVQRVYASNPSLARGTAGNLSASTSLARLDRLVGGSKRLLTAMRKDEPAKAEEERTKSEGHYGNYAPIEGCQCARCMELAETTIKQPEDVSEPAGAADASKPSTAKNPKMSHHHHRRKVSFLHGATGSRLTTAVIKPPARGAIELTHGGGSFDNLRKGAAFTVKAVNTPVAPDVATKRDMQIHRYQPVILNPPAAVVPEQKDENCDEDTNSTDGDEDTADEEEARPHCHDCERELESDDVLVKALGKLFHPECFRCDGPCNKKLSADEFYDRGDMANQYER
ncbi:hypothetical protein HK101_003214 [Irineochytrium annulatum]|nr:hypothetical protein HK101_003214 [Irineochytrium annulatum]